MENPAGAEGSQADVDLDGIGDACDDFNDNDGDGVPNERIVDSSNETVLHEADNCIDIYNPDQADGYSPASNGGVPTDSLDGTGDACQDVDEDGIQDSEDNCPLVANSSQFNMDRDDLGDACDDDVDGDGVDDVNDNCPLVANLDQVNSDGDERGDACDGGFNVSMTQSVEDLVCPSGSPVTEFQILSGEITMQLDEDFDPATINSDSVSVVVNQFELGVSDETTNNLGANNNTYDLILEIGEIKVEGEYNNADGNFTFNMSDGFDFEFAVLDDDGDLIYERTLEYEIIFKPKATQLNAVKWVLDARDRLNFDQLEVFFESNTDDFDMQDSETFEINEAVEVDDVFGFGAQGSTYFCEDVEPEVEMNILDNVTSLENSLSPEFDCENSRAGNIDIIKVSNAQFNLNYNYPDALLIDYELDFAFDEVEGVAFELDVIPLNFDAKTTELRHSFNVNARPVLASDEDSIRLDSETYILNDSEGIELLSFSSLPIDVVSNGCSIDRTVVLNNFNLVDNFSCDFVHPSVPIYFKVLDFDYDFNGYDFTLTLPLEINIPEDLLEGFDNMFFIEFDGYSPESREDLIEVSYGDSGLSFNVPSSTSTDASVTVDLYVSKRLVPELNYRLLLDNFEDVTISHSESSVDLAKVYNVLSIDGNQEPNLDDFKCFDVEPNVDFAFHADPPSLQAGAHDINVGIDGFIISDDTQPRDVFKSSNDSKVHVLTSQVDDFFAYSERQTGNSIWFFEGRETDFIQPFDLEETHLRLQNMDFGECFGNRYKMFDFTFKAGVNARKLFVENDSFFDFNMYKNVIGDASYESQDDFNAATNESGAEFYVELNNFGDLFIEPVHSDDELRRYLSASSVNSGVLNSFFHAGPTLTFPLFRAYEINDIPAAPTIVSRSPYLILREGGFYEDFNMGPNLCFDDVDIDRYDYNYDTLDIVSHFSAFHSSGQNIVRRSASDRILIGAPFDTPFCTFRYDSERGFSGSPSKNVFLIAPGTIVYRSGRTCND